MERTEPQGWHVEEIKAAVRMRFGTLQAFSAALGYHPYTLSVWLGRGRFNPDVQRKIAEALGEQPRTLWPACWNPDGNPKTVAEWKATRKQTSAHRSKREAA